MAFALDTLGYSKHLQDSGVPRGQAEAHAEAVRQFVMVEIVTKTDLLATKQELEVALENLGLRLTVRLSAMLAVGLGLLATLLKLT